MIAEIIAIVIGFGLFLWIIIKSKKEVNEKGIEKKK